MHAMLITRKYATDVQIAQIHQLGYTVLDQRCESEINEDIDDALKLGWLDAIIAATGIEAIFGEFSFLTIKSLPISGDSGVAFYSSLRVPRFDDGKMKIIHYKWHKEGYIPRITFRKPPTNKNYALHNTMDEPHILHNR